MERKVIFILLVSLPIYFFTLKMISDHFHRQELIKEQAQAKIILENVMERFRLFLDLPHSVGTMGADYFALGAPEDFDYTPFRRMLETHPEIYGLNVVDANGKIVKAWPYKENEAALGRITQNIEHIQSSYSRGQGEWLSAPFKLYQGEQGFVFYMPILKNNKLKGWFAPVVQMQAFEKKFHLQELLHSYELIIQDVITGSPFFATALAPDNKNTPKEETLKLYDREIRFLCWKKLSQLPKPLAKPIILLSAFLLSVLTLFIFRLYEQKRKVRNQLKDIGMLLKMTYQEAHTKLIGLHGELKAEKKDAIQYLNNLIEQIDLLQTMTWDEESSSDEIIPLMPFLEGQLVFFSESIENKELTVFWNNHSLQVMNIRGNSALLQNAISIVFAHAMILATPKSKLTIELSLSRDQKTALVTLTVPSETKLATEVGMERRIEVSRRALQLNDGQLNIQEINEGILIHIYLPISQD